MRSLQLALPFPAPANAIRWPNGLGFDVGSLEFWTDAGGVRDLDTGMYGEGMNWVAALADLTANPKSAGGQK